MSIAVVGATGAVGRALARRVHMSGMTPWLIGRSSDKLSEVSRECGGAPFAAVDMAAVDDIAGALGTPPADCRGLAYCAGDIVLKPLKRSKPSDFRACFDLHVVGAAETLKVLEPTLRKNSGSVVLFSTVAVAQGFANHAIVSSAKGAIEGMTRALAAEWAPKIRVNAVAPSISRSGMGECNRRL